MDKFCTSRKHLTTLQILARVKGFVNVPEPRTIAPLVGMGIIGAGMLLKRQHKAKLES